MLSKSQNLTSHRTLECLLERAMQSQHNFSASVVSKVDSLIQTWENQMGTTMLIPS